MTPHDTYPSFIIFLVEQILVVGLLVGNLVAGKLLRNLLEALDYELAYYFDFVK